MVSAGMSFYIESGSGSAEALSEVNASIDGDDVVYHNYFDGEHGGVYAARGTVTPVLRRRGRRAGHG